MSGFGSSVVNKSGKKIAPKAAPRRRPATQAPSLQPSLSIPSTSARTSAEPAVQAPYSNLDAAESNRRHLYTGNGISLALTPAAEPTSSTTATGIPVILSSSTASQPLVSPASTPNAAIITIAEPSAAPSSSSQPSSISRKRSAFPTGPVDATEPATRKLRGAARITRSSQPATDQHVEDPTVDHEVLGEHTGTERQRSSKRSKDNWVITTPAEITKTAAINPRLRKARQVGSKKKASKAVVTPGAAPSIATPEGEAPQETASRKSSSRVANAQRRKQKEQEMQAPQEPTTGTREADVEYRQDNLEDDQDYGENEEDGDEPSRRRKQKRRRRAETPEGAAMVTIVPSMVTMSELASRERRTGMKSDRERAMAKIDWVAVKQRRKDEYYDMAMNRGRRNSPSNEDDETGPTGEDGEEADFNTEYERIAAKRKDKRRGIQVRMVNGEAVIDEQSHKVDRHAIANDDVEELEEVDDDDLTKTFNSHSYVHMKRREPAERIPSQNRWGEEATDKFYKLLSSFGTDFQIISQMFPGRTRRHIKAKFVKEEKANPGKITAALLGGKMDMDVFKAESGKTDADFKDPRAVEEQLRVRREEREQEIEEQRLETEETNRQRKLAGDVSEPEDDDGVENEEDGTIAGAEIVVGAA